MPPSQWPESRPSQKFPATRWSLVHRAQQSGEEGDLALEELCQRYWLPVYAFLRGRGCTPEDAEDLTQSFFQHVLKKGLFQSAEAESGRLRNLLLTAIKHLHINHLRSEKALKRGGGQVVVSFDAKEAEQNCTDLLVTSNDPETIYLTAWARSLVQQAREKLKAIYLRAPRAEVAMALEAHLDPEDDRVPYREFAQKFQMKESVLRLHLYRLRKKFGELLREEVLQTVDQPEELDEEMRWIRGVLGAANFEH